MYKGLIFGFFALIYSLNSYCIPKEIDSLLLKPISDLSKWYASSVDFRKDKYNIDPTFDSSMVKNLFDELSTDMTMELNAEVYQYIKNLLTEKRSNIEIAIGLFNESKQIIEREVKRRKMPSEISLLPIILSGMNSSYISKQGGRGIWNLNYYVAIKGGLKISNFKDERLDIGKSTEVALDELNRLHTQLGSWNLAISAFSSSLLSINKAISSSGYKTNYWDILPFIEKKYAALIPAFFASVYIYEYYPEHDLIPPVFTHKDVIAFQSSDRILIEVLAKNINITTEELYRLNPGFRGRYVPAINDSLNFFIPSSKIEIAEKLSEKLIFQSKKEDIPETHKAKVVQYGHPENSTIITHVVKSGDVVGIIAEKYKIRASSLRQWNNIRGDRIYIGQKLKIYIDKERVIDFPQAELEENFSALSESDLTTYEVQFGDTLWDIVQMHPGNTIEGVQQINKINKELQPGQIIKLIKNE